MKVTVITNANRDGISGRRIQIQKSNSDEVTGVRGKIPGTVEVVWVAVRVLRRGKIP